MCGGHRFFSDRLEEELKDPAFRKAYEEADLPIWVAIQKNRDCP